MSDTADNVRTVFEHFCSDMPIGIDFIDTTDDEQTGEQFLSVVVSVHPSVGPEKARQMAIRPVFQAYARLVAEAGLDYPLEAILRLAVETDDGIPLMGTFRCAVPWVREHANDNLTLEQTIALVLETRRSPDDVATATSGEWEPGYDLEWRQAEPIDADEFPAQTPYEYWAGKSVEYPGSDEGTLSVARGGEDVWRACDECGWRSTLHFYAPDAVYCEGCDRQLGETDRPVEQDLVALEGSEIVAEDGETVATVEWFDDRIRVHEGDDA
ncbi:hypothetical protein Htur_5070 (plasmid) [Haloterrigena turkmenica DSM 5511]|uniref:Uncharacterized protein n=1 Tax=Haloterrigena turkmenica (strain ATCC 51198 / DSM 5511 / JCM 9101 / NCIMB 13204 / VKM B-1734 / 4k) TaxID=543526 RepID=D2S3L0_HALTV|nr:hypothetical protein [Haloterrigena turkmenica]ADB63957.1 hypothetical protein Htur_5070 [Haloterrigena turkmenica DSM 5511]